jgi:hypothetical protein
VLSKVTHANLFQQGYVMVPMHCLNHHGKPKLVGWFFLSNEKRETVELALEQLLDCHPEMKNKNTIFVMDKDFVQLAAISSKFPKSDFILCRYHVLTYIRSKKISKLHVPMADKEKLKALVNDLVFKSTNQEYDEAWQELQQLCANNPALEDFGNYMDKNWNQGWVSPNSYKDFIRISLPVSATCLSST